MALKRVVVTGLGALTPIGNNLDEFWTGLKSKEQLIEKDKCNRSQ